MPKVTPRLIVTPDELVFLQRAREEIARLPEKCVLELTRRELVAVAFALRYALDRMDEEKRPADTVRQLLETIADAIAPSGELRELLLPRAPVKTEG